MPSSARPPDPASDPDGPDPASPRAAAPDPVPDPVADAEARRRLDEAAAAWGYPDGAADRLEAMVRAVLDENTRVNLTAAATFAAAVEILALDAMPVAAAWGGARPPAAALDLGTGNGFPGAAVVARWPACRTWFVDRRAKKAAAVGRCLAAMGPRDVEVLAANGAELPARHPALRARFHLVTVRAVGDLAPTTREAAPLLAPGGRVVHWKSADVAAAEVEAGDAAARAVGLRRLDDVAFRVAPGRPARRLLVWERPA